MTEKELVDVLIDIVEYAIAAHGQTVRIHPEKLDCGWQILISDPDKDH